LLVATCLLFYFNYGKIKKAATKAIPADIEKSLGESIFKSSVDQSKIIQVPEVTKALETIFAKFKPALEKEPFQFHFYVIRNDELNAFALPGGYVVIHTGLIMDSQSPEEIAGVIAHEICHVTERHHIERVVSSLGVIVVCQIFVGDVSGLASIIIQGAQFLSMMQFNQSQESEADSSGFQLLKKAKISHTGFIEFFKRAKAKKDALPEEIKASLSIFSTHPPDDTRINRITELSIKEPYQPEKLEIDWTEVKSALKTYLNK
jgi:predicted Zn-dependent protease